MSQKSDIIDPIFEERWPSAGRPDKDKLAFRSEIARELLAQEDSTTHEELKKECELRHEEDMAMYHGVESNVTADSASASEAATDRYVAVLACGSCSVVLIAY